MAEALKQLSEAVEVGHWEMANAIRALSMDAVQKANSGHPGMPMGMADVATVLFTRFLRFDATVPDWPDRDRFVLSAGHGSMLLYSLLYLTGYPGMDIDEIKKFRQLGSHSDGHPERGHAPGIETTTGPLGQGVGNAVGMALAERLINARHGDDICNHYTYCMAGDGCLMEGISQEAISMAGHLKLGRLIVLFDDNRATIDGPTDLTVSDDNVARFRASGWHVARADGHDPEGVARAIENARSVLDKPSIIACRTIIGHGAPNKQGCSSTHGAPLGADEVKAAREEMGWPYPPFLVPAAVLAAWRAAGTRGRAARETWEKAAARLGRSERERLVEPMDRATQAAISEAVVQLKAEWQEQPPQKQATRVASHKVLEKLVPLVPGIIGGSADLTDSNGTFTDYHKVITPANFTGNYVHYGVREHAMAAAMNGMAVHGGIVPYGGSFLVFIDYCRPAIRMSSLMGQRVVYVMTHDSIGVGEDGPTHQPVEHLASLRSMPTIQVFRPADATETAECWELALLSSDAPSLLALTRQGVPAVRFDATAENRCAKGAYVLRDTEGARDVTLLATGSEVSVALQAAEMLAAEGIAAAVVSMPCWELFEAQPEQERAAVLGTAPRIAIEAGIRFGWDKWIGSDGTFIGMKGFGASAPGDELFNHFGITAEAAVRAAKRAIG